MAADGTDPAVTTRPATVIVDALEIKAIVGIHPDERVAAQKVVIDLELDTDVAVPAGAQARVDYALVADEVSQFVRREQFLLLETMAEAIGQRLFERFPIVAARIRVAKPGALPHAKACAVRISRSA